MEKTSEKETTDMCLAMPMQIKTIEGNRAVAEQDGVTRSIRIDFVPGIEPGDYVLVHAGVAIERIDAAEAAETLELIRAVAHEIH